MAAANLLGDFGGCFRSCLCDETAITALLGDLGGCFRSFFRGDEGGFCPAFSAVLMAAKSSFLLVFVVDVVAVVRDDDDNVDAVALGAFFTGDCFMCRRDVGFLLAS